MHTPSVVRVILSLLNLIKMGKVKHFASWKKKTVFILNYEELEDSFISSTDASTSNRKFGHSSDDIVVKYYIL